jgi:hypothetical protein
MVATMALSCCFIMLDAQTIQVRGFVLSHHFRQGDQRQEKLSNHLDMGFLWASLKVHKNEIFLALILNVVLIHC